MVDAEAERFLLLFNKKFSEYHEKKLNNENNENNANLDCEDGAESEKVKLLKKIRESIHSDEKVSKAIKS